MPKTITLTKANTGLLIIDTVKRTVQVGYTLADDGGRGYQAGTILFYPPGPAPTFTPGNEPTRTVALSQQQATAIDALIAAAQAEVNKQLA